MAIVWVVLKTHLLLQAAVSALQNQPIVNAVIDGDDIIYREYIDISVAVGTSKVSPPVFLYVDCPNYYFMQSVVMM